MTKTAPISFDLLNELLSHSPNVCNSAYSEDPDQTSLI